MFSIHAAMIAVETSNLITLILLFVPARAGLTEDFSVSTREAARSRSQNLRPIYQSSKPLDKAVYIPTNFQIDGQSLELQPGWLSPSEFTTILDERFLIPSESGPGPASESRNSRDERPTEAAELKSGNPSTMRPLKKIQIPVRLGLPHETNGIVVLDPASSTCSICLETIEPSKLENGKWEWTLHYRCPHFNHLFHISCLNPWLRTTRTCPVCRKGFDIEQDQLELLEGSHPFRSVARLHSQEHVGWPPIGSQEGTPHQTRRELRQTRARETQPRRYNHASRFGPEYSGSEDVRRPPINSEEINQGVDEAQRELRRPPALEAQRQRSNFASRFGNELSRQEDVRWYPIDPQEMSISESDHRSAFLSPLLHRFHHSLHDLVSSTRAPGRSSLLGLHDGFANSLRHPRENRAYNRDSDTARNHFDQSPFRAFDDRRDELREMLGSQRFSRLSSRLRWLRASEGFVPIRRSSEFGNHGSEFEPRVVSSIRTYQTAVRSNHRPQSEVRNDALRHLNRLIGDSNTGRNYDNQAPFWLNDD